jgi:hypothetical protein
MTTRSCTRTALALLSASWLAAAAAPARALTPAEAHRSAVAWLETHQNLDGSWGSGLTRPVATAEALLALAKAGRPRSPAAQKAAAWLLTRSFGSLDHRARAVRALAAAGFSTAGLSSFGTAVNGWGPVAVDQGVTSYDSALVITALHASGQQTGLSTLVSKVILLRRGDNGWSADNIPSSVASSDLTASAEIMRALAPVDATALGPTRTLLNGAFGPTTSTLELAARLGALYASGCPTGCTPDPIGMENELLNRAWGSDPLIQAVGLLAVSTRPGRTLGGGPTANDDGDALPNNTDAFPQNPAEWLDSDGDGIGNNGDADDDGDGVCEGAAVVPGQCSAASDAFELNPREWADTDGDGSGDNADADTDGDGVSDDAERQAGSDPKKRDTDGDGLCDGSQVIPPCTGANDACPAVAGAQDQDGDEVCSDRDECDFDPSDWRDTNDDGVCDLADDDDDGDTFSDAEELAAGSDPRSAASTPASLAGSGDFDGDGLTNASEENVHGTSPFLADSDQDGATDLAEVFLGSASNPAASPVHAPGVFSTVGAFTPSGATYPAETNAASLRATGTGGQPTPVARLGGSLPAAGAGFENLAGYQPQCTIGRDLDGDGLIGFTEAERGTSFARADTDGDGFADGLGGVVSTAGYTGLAWDLQPDGFLDGEDDHDTDPTDAGDHPGKPGDVAPLGLPDGRITAGDASVELQIVADPNRTASLSGQRRLIADQAADAKPDGIVDVRDALEVLKEAASAP